jgi:enamine deaminase RidA (YjgF/YER057c/UK114 family)
MSAEEKLRKLGIELPPAPPAMATYRTAVRSGNMLFVAGQGPVESGKVKLTGRLGENITKEQGYEAAKLSCVNSLAIIRRELGSLDRVKQVVRATVYVACKDGYSEQPAVANGATDLLKEVFGELGLPARAAVGVNALPANIPVEVELQVEVE